MSVGGTACEKHEYYVPPRDQYEHLLTRRFPPPEPAAKARPRSFADVAHYAMVIPVAFAFRSDAVATQVWLSEAPPAFVIVA